MSDKRITEQGLHELLESVEVEVPTKFQTALRNRLRQKLLSKPAADAASNVVQRLRRLPIWRQPFSENGHPPEEAYGRPRRFSLAPVIPAVIIVILAAALLTLGPPSLSPEPLYEPVLEVVYEPVFEPGACRFEVPYGYEVDCGDLIVPEDRSDPDGRTVRLHVAIFRSTVFNPNPDPVIYLGGGPGINHLAITDLLMSQFGLRITANRDFIVYNLRGSAYSEPELHCPGYNQLIADINRASPTKTYVFGEDYREERTIEFFADCRDNLVAQGIDLEMYDLAAHAADANDLRIALGYDQVNYYGTSYGTRVALTLMRTYPEGVRSAILDSAYPPQAVYYNEQGLNAYQAFSQFFADCANKPGCDLDYHNAESTFYQAVDNLNRTPGVITWNDQVVVYSGGDLIDATISHFYGNQVYETLDIINAAGLGDYYLLESAISGVMELSSEIVSLGAFYNVVCREEIPFASPAAYQQTSAGLPYQIVEHFDPSFEIALCEQWNVAPIDPAFTEPVASDIPVLLLAGNYDPYTPPRWTQMAAETLSNSYIYEIPGMAHAVTRYDDCAIDISRRFLDNLTVEGCPWCLSGCTE